MKLFRYGRLYLLLTVILTGCGGGGGSAPPPPPPPPPATDASPGGIWTGIDSDGGAVIAFVTETGRFHFIDEFLNQGSGTLSVSNGNDVTGNFQLVTELGVTFPDGTTLADCTLSGTVTERQIMTVTVNCTTTAGLQNQITVALDYDPLYERDSSLATIAGLYDDGSGIVTDIAADGTIFEQDPISGCVTNGQVSVIDPAFNAYDFQFEFSNCTTFAILNGTNFVGIATLDNTVTPAPELLIASATGNVAGTLVSLFIVEERLSPVQFPVPVAEYINDFSSSVGSASLFGDAILDSGSVRLTDSIINQLGSLVIDDLVPGGTVASFAARFDLQMGPGSIPFPADGISFNLGPLPNSAFGEEGIFSGLTISFDTFRNPAPDHIGIDVLVDGTVVATNSTNPFTNGRFARVSVDFNADGTLNLTFDGSPIFVDLLTGFTPQSSDRFGFGGHTGDDSEVNRIDNVRIFVLPR